MTSNAEVMAHEVEADHRPPAAALAPAVATVEEVATTEEVAGSVRYEQVLGRVRRLLIEQLHLRREPDEIDPDAVLFGTGLALDSVDAVELTVAIETEFEIKVPDNEESRQVLRTVNSLVDHLLRIKEPAYVG